MRPRRGANRAAHHEDVASDPGGGRQAHVAPQHHEVAGHLAGDLHRAVQGGDVGEGLALDDHVPPHAHELLTADRPRLQTQSRLNTVGMGRAGLG